MIGTGYEYGDKVHISGTALCIFSTIKVPTICIYDKGFSSLTAWINFSPFSGITKESHQGDIEMSLS